MRSPPPLPAVRHDAGQQDHAGSPLRDNGSLAQQASGLLAVFNRAGVLGLADVHTAAAVGRIGSEDDDRVRLALALAVRALRNGSVCLDLAAVHQTVYDEVEGLDLAELPWPDPDAWAASCRASPLVAWGAEGGDGRPLRLVDGLLYLQRYWQQEEVVRTQLQDRYAAVPPEVDLERTRAALKRLFGAQPTWPEEPDLQRLAVAVSALSRVTVLAGAPGTGKTTTVARLIALLRDQPGTPLRVALAAPTGKAAARLEEAVRSAADQLDPEDRDRLGEVRASTLHRLLGWLPGNRGRFRHDATNHLPHDVVVVDEMSMVSLTMMARLLEAVRPTARLILVGDPDQLSSVEAGAVLADVTGAPGHAPADLGRQLVAVRAAEPTDPVPVHGVVELRHTWRFGGAIEALARAVRTADGDAAMEILRSGAADVEFSEFAAEEELARTGNTTGAPVGLTYLQARVCEAGERTRDAARAGDVALALAALDRHRLLCAHRRGPYGVGRWGREAERWLAEAVPGYGEDGEFYLGRPLLVTANDYEMGLYNGDTGVVVNTTNGLRAAFARGAAATLYAPARLDALQTVHAMTVHRAQGSQFEAVSFVLPPAESPLLTRELLYTAVTRATRHVQVLGSEEAVRRAIDRPANRASGLRRRLGDQAGAGQRAPTSAIGSAAG